MNAIVDHMNSLGRTFVEFSGSMLVQSSILIALLIGVDLVLRRRVRAVFRYCLWMLVLVKLVLPTSLSLPVGIGAVIGPRLSTVSTPAVPQVETIAPKIAVEPTSPAVYGEPIKLQTDPVAVSPAAPPIAVVEMAAPVSLTWQAWLFVGWMVSVLVLGLLMIQRYVFVRGLIAQAVPAEGGILDLFENCLRQMGIDRGPELRISPAMVSPAACGLTNPVILMPEFLPAKLNGGQMQNVLLHELAHVRRKDLWINFAQTILQILYFYNPLLWVANAIIRRIREQAVDETVLVAKVANVSEAESAEDNGGYVETLVNVARLALARPALALRMIGVVESKSALVGRIRHILDRPMPTTAKLGAMGLAGILLLAIILLPMAKAERNEDNGTASQAYKAILPHDVTVQIVGISTFPYKDKEWWQPDGSKLPQSPFAWMEPFGSSVKANQTFAIQVLGPEGTTFMPHVSSGESWSGSQGSDRQGRPIKAYAVLTNQGLTSTDVTIRVGAGPWKTVATYDMGTGTSSSTGPGAGGILFDKPYEDEGTARIVAIDNFGPNTDVRVIAIDHDGKTHSQGSRRGGEGTGSLVKKGTFFLGTSLKAIKEIQFQTRPYEVATFKNVSLEPGRKTNVTVEVAKERAAVQPKDIICQTVYPGKGIDAIQVGDSVEKIKQIFGRPEQETQNADGSRWISYRKNYGMDFFIREDTGRIGEIRFNPGYKGQLATGIQLGDSLDKVLQISGGALSVVQTERETKDGNRVLLEKRNFGSSTYKFEDDRRGVLYWFDSNKRMIQFVVYKPYGAAAEPKAEAADRTTSGTEPQAAGSVSKEMVGTWFSRGIWGSSGTQMSIFPDGQVLLFDGGGKITRSRYDNRIIRMDAKAGMQASVWNGLLFLMEPESSAKGGLASVWVRINRDPQEQLITHLGGSSTQPVEAMARVSFRIVPEIKDISGYIEDLTKNGPYAGHMRHDKYQWFKLLKEQNLTIPRAVTQAYQGETYILLSNQPEETLLPDGWGLTDVAEWKNAQGNTGIRLELDENGGRRLHELTQAHVNQLLAILVDDGVDSDVVAAPVIRTPLSRQIVISAKLTPQEVERAAKMLMRGMPSAATPTTQTTTTQPTVTQPTTFLVIFKAAGASSPRTSRELLDLFNQQHPSDVRTHHYRTKIEGNELVGYILADPRQGKEALATELAKNPNIRIIEIKPADDQVRKMIEQMGQPSLPDGAGLSSSVNGSADIPEIVRKVARINIGSDSPRKIIMVFGEPQTYVWGQATFDRDHLPATYVMKYPGDFRVWISNNVAVELRFEGPSEFVHRLGLKVGTSMDEAVQILGPPVRTVVGGKNEFEDGVLYKNVNGNNGWGYYGKQAIGVRMFFVNNRVNALYLTKSITSAVAKVPSSSTQSIAEKTKDLPPPAVVRTAYQEAIHSAIVWVKMIDRNEYGASWDQTSSMFKGVVSRENWEEAVKGVRSPLGKVISRRVVNKEYTTTLPGAPDGEYVIIQCDTSFQNKKQAVETITPMKDKDGTWRVSGYYVK